MSRIIVSRTHAATSAITIRVTRRGWGVEWTPSVCSASERRHAPRATRMWSITVRLIVCIDGDDGTRLKPHGVYAVNAMTIRMIIVHVIRSTHRGTGNMEQRDWGFSLHGPVSGRCLHRPALIVDNRRGLNVFTAARDLEDSCHLALQSAVRPSMRWQWDISSHEPCPRSCLLMATTRRLRSV